jgi:hypothetical protein
VLTTAVAVMIVIVIVTITRMYSTILSRATVLYALSRESRCVD